MRLQLDTKVVSSTYQRLFRNRAWVLLWSGKAISSLGDVFFNLAVFWLVYTWSGSALQTAIVQVIWQASSVLFGPLAGTWADLWDRKRIMVLTNILAALVVGILALLIVVQRSVALWEVFVTVFLLNSLNTFLAPATFTMLPEVVEEDLLLTSAGLFSTIQQATTFLGNALAGVVIILVGMAGAVLADALSFVLAAMCIIQAPLPIKTAVSKQAHPSSWRAFLAGWQIIKSEPQLKAIIWLCVGVNVASYLGPLLPALVHTRLHGNAAVYGVLNTVGVIGGVAGGMLAGRLARRLGAGRLLALVWGVQGLCLLGQAASTSLILTTVLETLIAFVATLGNVISITLLQILVPQEYRGRVFSMIGGLAVLVIPFSALAGGWLADLFGPAPLFAFGGIWLVGIAVLTLSSRQIQMIHA